MSAAVTSCGAAGWVSRLRGYRYHPRDPLSGAPWPPMPTVFTELATEAADWAGYDGFAPDARLINRYEPFDVTGGEAHEVKGYDALMRLHEADPSKLLSDKGYDSDEWQQAPLRTKSIASSLCSSINAIAGRHRKSKPPSRSWRRL
jgi:hypothetical protein